jgi:uncharacterized damage-inducible protein DinB
MAELARREVSRMLTIIRRAYAGPCWHGPAVKEALADISWEQAAKPRGNVHCILELVIHIAAWKSIVASRLRGTPVREITAEIDWPKVEGSGEAAWQNALERLERAQAELLEALGALTDEQLGEDLKNTAWTIEDLLHGVAQHDLYHTGQIALLKKL